MEDITDYFETKYEKRVDYLSIFIASFIAMALQASFLTAFEELSSEIFTGFNIFILKYSPTIFFIMFVLYKFFDSTRQISGIESDTEIYSIKDDIRIDGHLTGSFVLGSGSVSGEFGEKDYYVFYEKTKFGLIKGKTLASKTEVVQRDDIKPSLKDVYVNGKVRTFLFVPTNTIKKNIKIDL